MRTIVFWILALVLAAAIAAGPIGCYLEIRFDPSPCKPRPWAPICEQPEADET